MEYKNNTYAYIINYIRKNKAKLQNQELKFLLNYISCLKENNFENIIEPSVKIIVNDLKKLHKNISNGELTYITYQRLQKELELFDAILQNDDLYEISYELDKLYIECDMGVRQNSALAKKICDLPSDKVLR